MTLVAALAVGLFGFGAWLLGQRPTAPSFRDFSKGRRNRRIVPLGPTSKRRSQARVGADTGPLRSALVLELVAAILEAGSPLHRALAIASRVSGMGDSAVGRAAAALELGVPWDQAWPDGEPDPEVGEIKASLRFAAATGAPSAQLISARARLVRRTRHRELERRAAALGVRLVVPLGACSLPAFLCLGVVPVLISMMPS